jgi:hypothetical protein
MTQPTDDTQPHPTVSAPPPQPNVLSGGSGPTPVGDPPPPESSPPAAPSMQALPPAATPSDWREPPWSPPRPRPSRGPSLGAIVFGGLILLAGVWFFLERTLGIELPDLRWSAVGPVLLIALGGFIVLRALGRR